MSNLGSPRDRQAGFYRMGLNTVKLLNFIPTFLSCLCLGISAELTCPASQWAFLDNGQVRIGVLEKSGAAIGWFSVSGSARNLINHWDCGRMVQQSYYGQSDGSTWWKNSWTWNPVQGGDARGDSSKVLQLNVTTNQIYAQTLPKHWANGSDLPEVRMEEWITLTGKVAHVHFKMTYHGTNSQPMRSQEVPAFFAQPDLDTLVLYDGPDPWTEKPLNRSKPGWPNEERRINEHWAAYMDKNDFGVGAYNRGADTLTCYRFGDGQLTNASCSYFAPLVKFAITPGFVFEYDVFLSLGKSSEIRETFHQIDSSLCSQSQN